MSEMSVRLPGKNFADVFLRLVWMLLFIPPGFWLKRDDAMAGNEARDMVSKRRRCGMIYIT